MDLNVKVRVGLKNMHVIVEIEKRIYAPAYMSGERTQTRIGFTCKIRFE